jgi:hypothetical protein
MGGVDWCTQLRYLLICRRKHLIPCMPNQASEAQAHHMNELAKKLLSAAGGNQSTAIFNVQHNVGQANQPHGSSAYSLLSSIDAQ